MKEKKNNLFFNVLLLIAIFVGIYGTYTPAKVIYTRYSTEVINKKAETKTELVSYIDKYQNQYFTIVKRNNVLLSYEDDSALNKDRKELKKLYKQIEKQITNKQYLKKYKNIEKRYAVCNEITTPGINEFMRNYYNDVDTLLNEVYKNAASKITSEDFKKLTVSEKKWIKDVEDYKKVFDSMKFGTIGTSIYYDYEIDMKKFRVLLLMLYL